MMDLYLEILIPVLFLSVTMDISIIKAIQEQLLTWTGLQGFLLVPAPVQTGHRNVAVRSLT